MSSRPRRLEWSGTARAQLREILAYYVAQSSPDAGEWVLSQIEAKVQQLAQFPFSGPQIEGLDESYRRARGGSYILLYRVPSDPPVIRIFAVRHGRRRPLSAAAIAALDHEGEQET